MNETPGAEAGVRSQPVRPSEDRTPRPVETDWCSWGPRRVRLGGKLRPGGRAVWRSAVSTVGLKGLHFHDLRRCAATLAAITV